MPIARFQLPDGRVARFEVPEGTTPEQAQSMFQAQLPAITGPRPDAIPTPREPTTWEKVRPYVAPAAEIGGTMVGGYLGALAGTVASPTLVVNPISGGMAGAGLGNAIAKEGLEAADVAFGYKKPRQGTEQITEPLKNFAEGAAFEGGGRVAGAAIGKGIGKLMDSPIIPTNKAVKIVKNALGPDLPQAVNTLKANAGKNVSAAQATADLNSPAWQALAERATARDPRFLGALEKVQNKESLNALTKLAGGTNAAELRAVAEAGKDSIRATTTPMRDEALQRANLGQEVARLESLSAQLGEQASAEVSKVKRLMEAGELAKAHARLDLIKKGLPTGLTKYHFFGELSEKAFNEWSNKAAQASLDLGQGARFAQETANALRAAGIKPLESEPLIRSIKVLNNNPEFAGNDLLMGAVRNVTDDIAKWTEGGGIIDARALDAIRKNSVNAAIQQMRPGVDATTQRNLAAGVLSKIKPAIDDAIEAAGGKGYKEYLAEYANLSRQLGEKRLTGEALQLWKTDKDAFVRLVQNESPETVEKFLGPKQYDIAKELADDTMATLEAEAAKVIRNAKIKEQSAAGQDALKELLLQNMSKFRVPSYLSAVVSTTNKALQILEKRIGTKTMNILTESLKTPQGAANLLETLPATERNRVLKLLSNPKQWSPKVSATAAGATAGVNALVPDQDVENQLAR